MHLHRTVRRNGRQRPVKSRLQGVLGADAGKAIIRREASALPTGAQAAGNKGGMQHLRLPDNRADCRLQPFTLQRHRVFQDETQRVVVERVDGELHLFARSGREPWFHHQYPF